MTAKTTAKPEPSRAEQHIPTVAFVQRQFFRGKEPTSELEVKNETLQVHRFLTEPAKINVSMGLTLNLGNFEAARIDVGLVVPCYREETDDAYVYAKKWVETRLGTEVQDIRANKPSLF
jgi:hypothetical protein